MTTDSLGVECYREFIERPTARRLVRAVLFTMLLPISVPLWLAICLIDWIFTDD